MPRKKTISASELADRIINRPIAQDLLVNRLLQESCKAVGVLTIESMTDADVEAEIARRKEIKLAILAK